VAIVYGDNGVSCSGFPEYTEGKIIFIVVDGDINEIDMVVEFFFQRELNSGGQVIELCLEIMYIGTVIFID
jgi:hypothetical protein